MNTQAKGSFSWSLGGLIGSAVGCSVWMPASAIVADWPLKGLVVSFIALAVIWLSVPLLWRQRNQISAFSGMLILLTLCFFSTLGFLISAHLLDLNIVLSWPPLKVVRPIDSLWILLLFPALALLFYLRCRSDG